MFRFLLLPWWRGGRMTSDGMLVVAYLFLWFQDPLGNLVSTQLYYCAYWVNRGSWTLGSMPGRISPAGHHLPEPIHVMGFGYLWLGFSTALLACSAMRWMRERCPRSSGLELMLLALAIGVVLDTTAEVALAAAGTFAWPAVIKGLIPMAGLSMYATVNQRYPNHLENGMCVVGPLKDQCPRPGLAMPRPPYPDLDR